jgi:hypothetical protein
MQLCQETQLAEAVAAEAERSAGGMTISIALPYSPALE